MKLTRLLLLPLSIAILTFLGGFEEVAWAERAAKFIIIVGACLGTFVVLVSAMDMIAPRLKKSRRADFRFGLDFLVAVLIASTGWFFTAFGYLYLGFLTTLINRLEDENNHLGSFHATM